MMKQPAESKSVVTGAVETRGARCVRINASGGQGGLRPSLAAGKMLQTLNQSDTSQTRAA